MINIKLILDFLGWQFKVLFSKDSINVSIFMHKLNIVIDNETVTPSELLLLFSSHGLWLLTELAVSSC